jgi:hypothetical protein
MTTLADFGTDGKALSRPKYKSTETLHFDSVNKLRTLPGIVVWENMRSFRKCSRNDLSVVSRSWKRRNPFRNREIVKDESPIFKSGIGTNCVTAALDAIDVMIGRKSTKTIHGVFSNLYV